jgi:integrase
VEELANRKIMLPQYGTVMKRGVLYYRTRIKDANGKLVALYAKTPEELYNKETLALEQIENATFHRKTPTVAEYCEKWLLMQSCTSHYLDGLHLKGQATYYSGIGR